MGRGLITAIVLAVPLALALKATQLILFLNVFGASPTAIPLLEPRSSTWEQESLCTGPLKGCLGFQQPLSHLVGWNPHCFSQLDIVRIPLSVLVLLPRESGFGLRPLAP